MIKRLLLLLVLPFMGILNSSAAGWYLIGTVCDWSPENAIEMKAVEGGKYTVTIDDLYGGFNFIADRNWDAEQLFAKDFIELNGNCTVDLTSSGYSVLIQDHLYNVTITLDPAAMTVKFSGMPAGQVNIPLSEKEWYLIGDLNDWNLSTSLKMEKQEDGGFTCTVPSLTGSFKFHADDNWNVNFGCPAEVYITGNCEVPVKINGANFTAGNLKDVTITLYPDSKIVKFSGLPKDQEVELDENVARYGMFILTDSFSSGNNMVEVSDGVYTSKLNYEGKMFFVSKALLWRDLDTETGWRALPKFLYGPVESNLILSPSKEYPIKNPCDKLSGWMIEDEGAYTVTVDLNNMTIIVEKEEDSLYICGNVYNSQGIYNDFTCPSIAKKEFYDSNFRLTGENGIYTGEYRLPEAGDPNWSGPAQFRFFTALNGWTSDFSLGASEPDFSSVPVVFSGTSTVESDIINHGLGNWAFDEPGKWIQMEVNINTMKVLFTLSDHGSVESLTDDAADGNTVWFNLQGARVQKPEKGMYIKVSGSKSEKTIL